MLKHVVMWRFREGAEGKSRAEHARWMKEHLEALCGIVPQIRTLEVGINEIPSAAACDTVLIATFDSAADLEAYKLHPAHAAVSSYCKRVRENRTVVDYTF